MRARVALRTDHFMPASLIASQFEALEEPREAIVIDARNTPESIVSEILRELGQA